MKILVLSYPEAGATPQSMGDHLPAEAATAWEHYVGGFIREAYVCGQPTGPGAALIVEATDAAAARSLLEEFPLRRAGLVRFEVIELGPFFPRAALHGEAMSAHAM